MAEYRWVWMLIAEEPNFRPCGDDCIITCREN